MNPLPPALHGKPFTRRQALDLGVSPKTLRGKRFVRLHRNVYCLAEDAASDLRLEAAQLALPADAHLTDISRIQALGLDYGPVMPLHFVRQGELHLEIPGIFLHRTKQLAPTDDVGVIPDAAFIAYCRRARVIDAIKVGNWLLQHEHMDLSDLIELAGAHTWRDGAFEALYVSNYLTADSRSLKESETAAVLEFAGLPRPRFNVELAVVTSRKVIGDLVYEEWLVVVEYEGRHHQELREQDVADIDRYKAFRDHGVRYVQITDEKLERPRRAVRAVHEELRAAGYDGPAPEFGEQWHVLFTGITRIVGKRGPLGEAA
jgi:very-short-patch-repair endonuclease